jgi:DNA-binding GntR family transcriptional regulator
LKDNHDVQGPGQEQKVTLALNVSRGSVREALLILERRHLIAILPRRGAHVTELTEHNVRSLCALMSELYILLGNAVAHGWKEQADMAPFVAIQQRLNDAYARQDIRTFVDESFSVMRASTCSSACSSRCWPVICRRSASC